MGFLKPYSARQIHKLLDERIRMWDGLADEQKASGEYINPDEPVVLSVPNQDHDFDEEDDGNLYFHILSFGGGGDIDDDGNECGHDGVQLDGMEIDQQEYLYNGRRLSNGENK